MAMTRRICVVTGSRAEYGLLYWVLHELRDDPAFTLQLVVTGMHLAHEFGHTVDEIERDGFSIDRRVEMLVSGDSPAAVARSIGLGVIGMSDALEQLRPEIVLVLGDRFEIFAAAQACLVHNVPLAHIAGGDTTEGALDEAMRHAITKMAHVHFATNAESARRVRQLGEDPRQIYTVGSPGLDHLHRRPLLDRTSLEEVLGAPLGERNLLVTFHPVTLDERAGIGELEELLQALDTIPADTTVWCSKPNADTGGRAISVRLAEWAAVRPGRVHVFASLGQLRYLSLMAHADAVVGNSSSGLYEAPSFGVPTVDVGDRQRGRLAAASVIRSAPTRDAIAASISRALALGRQRDVVNPYGDGDSARRIVAVLRRLGPPAMLLKKVFHDEASRG
jgi:UDP-N-acetylglucosamine 2-epimerase (non-hydrolysing)/GDP/UDP-N,N'-diacetylbacillosamine 2-epimerase (hydrolysing)